MKRPGPVTLSQVKRALQELGGEATWADILNQVTENRNGDYSYFGGLKTAEPALPRVPAFFFVPDFFPFRATPLHEDGDSRQMHCIPDRQVCYSPLHPVPQ